MSNNNNSNSNNNRRRGPPRPFPFNTQPMANDPIWREYGYNMPNDNGFQLAQSYPATPNRGTLEYTVPPSPPRLVRSRGFLRNRSASINSTATTIIPNIVKMEVKKAKIRVNSEIKRIKVIKIEGVERINENSFEEKKNYWYYPESGVVYDYELDYPIGKVALIDGIPEKQSETTYIVSNIIQIPKLKNVI